MESQIIKGTLELLNIEEFIQKNQCRKVTSSRIFSDAKNFKLDPEGIYSEVIFGRRGSKERFQKFGYIETLFTFTHPIAADILRSLFGRKVVDNLQTNTTIYMLKTGALISSADLDDKSKAIYEINTIDDFVQILRSLKSNENIKDEYLLFKDFYLNQDEKSFNFLLENLEKIFINKWLIIPAGYRDIIIQTNGTYRELEISEAYRKLIDAVNNLNETISQMKKQQELQQKDEDDDLLSLLTTANKDIESINEAQKYRMFYIRLQHVVDLILNQISGKTGLFRGSKLAKRVDHVVRLVLGHNNKLDINEVQIPWMFLLKLYEPFVIYHITKNDDYADLKEFFKQEIDVLSPDNFREYFNEIVRNPSIIPDEIKERIIELLQYIIDGKHPGDTEKYVLVIRHPVESRDSILFLKPVIDKENSYVARLPQVLFATLGADVDGDQINIYALHTKKALEEAKKADPKYTYLGASSIIHYTQDKASTDMDLSIAIYRLTKEPA